MERIDLNAGFRRLNASLGRMRDLMAWDRLKEHEARPHEPPSFQIYDPTATDLRNEYSHFLFTAVELHDALRGHGASIPESMRRTLQRKLAKLEQEARQLDLHQRCLGY